MKNVWNFVKEFFQKDRFDQLRMKIYKGNLDKARNEIKALLENKHIAKKEELRYRSLLVEIHFIQSDFKSTVKEATKIFKISKQENFFTSAFYVALPLFKAYITLGQPSESLKIIQECESILPKKEKNILYRKSTMNLLKGRYFHEIGEYNTSLEFLNNSLDYNSQRKDKILIIETLIYLAWNQFRLGNPKQHKKYLEQALAIVNEENFLVTKDEIFLNLGNVYFTNEREKALDLDKKALALAEKINNKMMVIKCLNNIGLYYHSFGELNEALEYYSRALTVSEKLAIKRLKAVLILNIGEIIQQKGELDSALEYIRRSLRIFEELGEESGTTANAYTQIGAIFREKGEIVKAKNYHMQALELREKIGHQLMIAQSVFYLFEIAVENNNLEEAEAYLNRMKSIQEETNTSLLPLDQGVEVAQAIFLKESSRTRDKMKALDILQELLAKETLVWRYPQLVNLNLAELLFFEYQSSKNPKILEEIRKVTDKLSNLAKKQKSYSLLATTKLLQGKLAILESAFTKAQELLSKAQNIADSKGLHLLARSISSEHDNLLRIKNEEEISLDETLEQEVGQLLKKMKNQKALEIPEEQMDKPILLLVVSETGLTIYSKSFSDKIQVDEQLIGGFLTALKGFGQELFTEKTAIDRIMYKDYILAFKTLGSMLFSYVFQGASYSALKKLDKILFDLQNHPTCMKNLNNCLEKSQYLGGEEGKILTEIINPVLN